MDEKLKATVEDLFVQAAARLNEQFQTIPCEDMVRLFLGCAALMLLDQKVPAQAVKTPERAVDQTVKLDLKESQVIQLR